MPLRHVALAVFVTAIWGFNFVIIRFGLDSYPPLLFTALRFLAASLPFLPFVGRPGIRWPWVVAIGAMLGAVQFGLLFVGMDLGVPAGLASLVMQAQVFFTILIGAIVLKDRPRPIQLVGMAVAAAGIVLIGADLGQGGTLGGLALVIAAAASWGVGNVLVKAARPPDILALTVWMSLVPPLPLLALSAAVEGPERMLGALAATGARAVGVLVYIAAVSTVVGYSLWNYLLRTHSATVVTPFALLVPVFGFASAALFLGERLPPSTLAASALVFAGLALVVLRWRPPADR
jgi:O-acetylserine/cysteine efflux transporter